jgi:hypothetical protein
MRDGPVILQQSTAAQADEAAGTAAARGMTSDGADPNTYQQFRTVDEMIVKGIRDLMSQTPADYNGRGARVHVFQNG